MPIYFFLIILYNKYDNAPPNTGDITQESAISRIFDHLTVENAKSTPPILMPSTIELPTIPPIMACGLILVDHASLQIIAKMPLQRVLKASSK